MQSLYALRLLLNTAAFALALGASSRHAWSVVESPAVGRWTASDAPDAKTPDSSTLDSSDLIRLTFSPNEYCLDAINGSSDCHSYAYLLTQPSADAAVFNLTTLPRPGLGLGEELLASTASSRLQAATSSWCVAPVTSATGTGSSSSSGNNGAWLLQGAQSLACLVVLETCAYSVLLWLLVGAGSVVGSLATLYKGPDFENGASVATLAQAALGALVVVEWAGYSLYMMDLGDVAVLQLVVQYGVSFRCALIATGLALLSCRVSAKISSRFSTIHYAKLHALPPSPRSRSPARPPPWSPHHHHSPSPRMDLPEVEDEDATLDCLEQAVDPLTCPANYRT